MGSINAQRAALKVSETIRKGERVRIGKILRDTGYSDETANSPTLVTRTKSYRTALALEQKPLIEGLQREINEIKAAMGRKNKDEEEYRTLVGSLDILTKNYQLLSGGATERQVFVLPSEVMNKNVITASSDVPAAPVTKDGSTEPSVG